MTLADDFLEQERREIERISHRVLDGGCKSFEEYLAQCARIAAHDQAVRNFRATLKKYFDEDDVDNLAENAE
jgi:hypothetical protein